MTNRSVTSPNSNNNHFKIIPSSPDSLTILINKTFSLPKDYVPSDLIIPNIPFSFTNYSEKKWMRKEAAIALEGLFKDASEDRLTLFGVSGYRSYARQLAIYSQSLEKNGYEHASQYSAMPGHSEHQSGLAMDVSTISIHNRLDVVFRATPEGRWLEKNSWKYGYIIRYPEDKSHITGYAYEPWHIRYVGIDLAKELTEKNITLEEYYNYQYFPL